MIDRGDNDLACLMGGLCGDAVLGLTKETMVIPRAKEETRETNCDNDTKIKEWITQTFVLMLIVRCLLQEYKAIVLLR